MGCLLLAECSTMANFLISVHNVFFEFGFKRETSLAYVRGVARAWNFFILGFY